MQKKYLVNADILRIIAGIAVVFIHASDSFLIYPPYWGIGGLQFLILSFLNAASRICVPLFIMLSGYLLLRPEKNLNFKEFYIRRAGKISIPLVFWLIIYFLAFFLTGNSISLNIIISFILTNNIGVLYFLIIILELYAITPLLYIFLQKTDSRSHAILFSSSVLFTISLNIMNIYVPKAHVLTENNILTIFIPYISYYIGGYYLGSINFSSTKKILALFGFWVSLLFTLFSTDSTAVSAINASGRQFDSFNVFLMSIFIFIFFINNSFIKRVFSRSTLTSFIKIIASSIFGIYLIHPYILLFINKYPHLNPGDIYSPMIIFIIIKAVAIFMVSFGIVLIGRKIPVIKSIFGE
jgi:surface polysaccharide O-acyltransferase-like enzyme